MPASGAPIAVSGYLDDVGRTNGHYYLTVHDWSSTDITFAVDCDDAVAQRLIGKNIQFQTISLIAKITSLEKAQSAATSGGNQNDENAPVDADTSSGFVAHGECIQVIDDSP